MCMRESESERVRVCESLRERLYKEVGEGNRFLIKYFICNFWFVLLSWIEVVVIYGGIVLYEKELFCF